MGDRTNQNWTKRDEKNKQGQEEKKVAYETAAELAVKEYEIVDSTPKSILNFCACRQSHTQQNSIVTHFVCCYFYEYLKSMRFDRLFSIHSAHSHYSVIYLCQFNS